MLPVVPRRLGERSIKPHNAVVVLKLAVVVGKLPNPSLAKPCTRTVRPARCHPALHPRKSVNQRDQKHGKYKRNQDCGEQLRRETGGNRPNDPEADGYATAGPAVDLNHRPLVIYQRHSDEPWTCASAGH